MHRILKDHTRQEIVRILGENENATYTDLLGLLQISTGKLNYHLKILAPFLSKQNGNYSLTDTGKNLYHVLESFQIVENGEEKSVYSMIGWLLLLISLSSLYFMILPGNPYIEFAGIITMIISQFMFYYDGKFKFNTMEFLGILLISLLFSGAAIMNGVEFYPNLASSLNFIVDVPVLIPAAMICGSSLSWAQSSAKRTLLTVGSFIFESFILYWFFTSSLVVILSLPVITILSLVALKFSGISFTLKEILIAFSIFFTSLIISVILVNSYINFSRSITFPLPMLAFVLFGYYAIKK